jgi:hypothetical protein
LPEEYIHWLSSDQAMKLEFQEPIDEAHAISIHMTRAIKRVFRKKRQEKWSEGTLMELRFEERLGKYDAQEATQV